MLANSTAFAIEKEIIFPSQNSLEIEFATQTEDYVISNTISECDFSSQKSYIRLGVIECGEKVVSNAAKTSMKALPQGLVPNAGGKIVSFTTKKPSTFYRVYSSSPNGGAFLTKVAPKSSAFARQGLALPSSNTATYIQKVIVPRGVTLQRSRTLGAFGQRGGLEQFQILNFEPGIQFLPGVPFY